MIARAVRSFTLPPGLRCSHLINTRFGRPALTFFSSMRGVLPIASMTSMRPDHTNFIAFATSGSEVPRRHAAASDGGDGDRHVERGGGGPCGAARKRCSSAQEARAHEGQA